MNKIIVRVCLLVMAFSIVLPRVAIAEDVPPAVPVDAVEVESLPLPEPVYAKPKTVSSSPKQKAVASKKATQSSKEPNILERFWKKISTATKAKPVEDKQPETKWVSKKNDEPKVTAVRKDSPSTKKAETRNYLRKVLRPVEPEGRGFYVLELFTTQACPFCPKADGMMKTYSALSHVIALSCHVDYFDVKEGSLSQPICSSRQTRYESFLKGGPKYTPQMVVNGRFDAVGYLSDKVATAFKQAHKHPVDPVSVELLAVVGDEPPTYQVELPEIEEGRYNLWLIAYDLPRTLTVKDGANARKNMAYYNAVSHAEFLGSWRGQSKKVTIDSKLPEKTRGFAFLVQNSGTGAIVLAGKNQ